MKYEQAVRLGCEAAKAQWVLGDLAREIDPKYGDATLEHFASDIRVEYKTLLDYKRVAEAYEKSERSEICSWSVHQIFATQDDRADLVRGWEGNAGGARVLVRSRNGNDPADEPDPEPEPKRKPKDGPKPEPDKPAAETWVSRITALRALLRGFERDISASRAAEVAVILRKYAEKMDKIASVPLPPPAGHAGRARARA